MNPCPITGGKCTCKDKRATSTMGQALLVDYKAALRKVFSDHAFYTSFLICESLPDKTGATKAVAKRLLENPNDISKLIEPVVGYELALPVKDEFTKHLKLAAATLEPLRIGNAGQVKVDVSKFLANGNDVARALSNLNPDKLPLSYVKELMKTHNNFVVKLATLRSKSQFEEYNHVLDDYYKHILMMSDCIYEAL